jgi:FkbM family methyltransferase
MVETYIKIDKHIKPKTPIRGIIHVGAHEGQEYEYYLKVLKVENIIFYEPMKDIFKKLVANCPEAICHNFALGNFKGEIYLNVSNSIDHDGNSNNGQSSSILKPDKHLMLHKEVRFDKRIDKIPIDKLDNQIFDWSKFNMLVADVQGYELEVLKGAEESLIHFDYIYLEVNKDSVYMECALKPEIDEYLMKRGFLCVETNWVTSMWGDAMYVRTNLNEITIEKVEALLHSFSGIGFTWNIDQKDENEVPVKISIEKPVAKESPEKSIKSPETKMYNLPQLHDYQLKQPFQYPDGNFCTFEDYLCDLKPEIIGNTERIFLPIAWTNWYNHSQHGEMNLQAGVSELQKVIDKLPKLKYWTYVQYDDGILNDISGLDIIVYASGCIKDNYYPVPLTYYRPNEQPFISTEKPILAFFRGIDTNGLRQKMVTACNGKAGFDVSFFNNLPPLEFSKKMSQCKFALCPRGYGVNSFRIYEALKHGAVPVYISDRFLEPFNYPFDQYGVKILPHEIVNIEQILKSVDYEILRENGKIVFNEYFKDYETIFSQIQKTLI